MEEKKSFFSLSGFSGILIGIFWLLAVYATDVFTNGYAKNIDGSSQLPIAFLEIGIIVVLITVILLSLFVLWKRAKKKAKRNQVKLWNPLSKKQRIHTIIPILGLLIILIVVANKGYYSFVTPLLLSFYGLLLLNLGRFNSRILIYLAMTLIILAVASFFVYDRELVFLAIGFGILPMIYGILTLNRNKKATAN